MTFREALNLCMKEGKKIRCVEWDKELFLEYFSKSDCLYDNKGKSFFDNVDYFFDSLNKKWELYEPIEMV